MQNITNLQENNYRKQRQNLDDSVLLSYTQTSTREKTKEENRPKIASLEEFKRKQLENSKLLLEAVQSHKIKNYDKIFDYEELADEVYSVSRYRNASKCELKKKSNRENTIKHSRGDRKQITEFSYRARTALLDVVNKLDREKLNQKEILFITLTYDENTEENLKLTAEDYNRHIRAFMRVLINRYKDRDFFAIARFDLQKRLIGHFHVVTYNVDYIHYEEINKIWCDVIKQKARTDVQRARSYKAVDNYFSKRLAKVKDKYAKADLQMNKAVEIKSKVEAYICSETDNTVLEHLRKLKIGRHYSTYNNANLQKYINEEQTDLTKDEYHKLRREKKKLAISRMKKKLNKTKKELADLNVVLTTEQEKYLDIASIKKHIYAKQQKLADLATDLTVQAEKQDILAHIDTMKKQIEIRKKNYQHYSREVKKHFYLLSHIRILDQKLKLMLLNHKIYSNKSTNSLTNNFYLSNRDLDRLLECICDREIEWAAIERDESLQKAA